MLPLFLKESLGRMSATEKRQKFVKYCPRLITIIEDAFSYIELASVTKLNSVGTICDGLFQS